MECGQLGRGLSVCQQRFCKSRRCRWSTPPLELLHARAVSRTLFHAFLRHKLLKNVYTSTSRKLSRRTAATRCLHWTWLAAAGRRSPEAILCSYRAWLLSAAARMRSNRALAAPCAKPRRPCLFLSVACRNFVLRGYDLSPPSLRLEQTQKFLSSATMWIFLQSRGWFGAKNVWNGTSWSSPAWDNVFLLFCFLLSCCCPSFPASWFFLMPVDNYARYRPGTRARKLPSLPTF